MNDQIEPIDLIQNRLKESMDPAWWSAVVREQCQAVGYDHTAMPLHYQHRGLPYYPDLSIIAQEVGTIRKTLQAALIARSRVMSNDPEPEFAGLDRVKRQVRQKLFETRYGTDMTHFGSWSGDVQDGWTDGEQHGTGVVEIGVRTNRATNKQRVHVRHSPLTCTLLDPYERNPRRCKSIGFVDWMSENDARAMYGEHVSESDVFTAQFRDMRVGRPMRYVPVVRYYSTGLSGYAPTFAVFIGSITKGPVTRKPNPFGGMIPAAFMTGFLAPGLRRPLGRVALQNNAEKTLQTIIDAVKQIARTGRAMRAIDMTSVDPLELESFLNGDTEYLKVNGTSGKSPFYDAPSLDIAPGLMKLYQIFDQEFTQQSHLSDLDRGSGPTSQRTKYELMQIQQSLAANGSSTTKNTIDFLIELAQKATYIAGMYDRDPVSLAIDGVMVPYNVPDKPASWMVEFCKEVVPVTLNRQSLLAGDDDSKATRILQKLSQLAPYLGKGISFERYLQELLRALAYDDTDSWIDEGQAAQTEQQQQQQTVTGNDQQQMAVPASVMESQT